VIVVPIVAALHRDACQGGKHDPHLVDDTGADEIMVTSVMCGRDARFQSYELLAAEWGLRAKQDTRFG
jgi:hypothetical protein